MNERLTYRDAAGNVGTVGEFVSTYSMMQQLCALEEDVERGRLVRVTRCKDCMQVESGAGKRYICGPTRLEVEADHYCSDGYPRRA
jgi:hypothetical protein